MVHGSTVRHAVLSRLSEATPYSIRMTSFGSAAGPDAIGGESDFSNSVVKATLGQLLQFCVSCPINLKFCYTKYVPS